MKMMTCDGEIDMHFPSYTPSAFYTHTVNIVQVIFSAACLLLIAHSLKLRVLTAYMKRMLNLRLQQVQELSSGPKE